MEISRHEIKALSSDTRVMMMKSLGERRKMPSELSRELSMAPSTMVEHLQVLEKSGLIKRIETGHKWKYYELTDKGRSLVRPRFPVQFVVMLSLGLVMVIGSISNLVGLGAGELRQTAEVYSGAPVVGAAKELAVDGPLQLAPDYSLLIVAAGILLIIYSAVKLWSKLK